ncbi:Ig-like domain-containing protein [Cellulomonas composti]|uniref:ATPase AAA n=1 Tax=Cellulomonas composti TaxID=266130 RepID=A0A511J9Q9_9CELL|nr:fibronectin type III domain-containing protein [Cellulomonas composti]GEL94735.1 ATPase AAA [Cellulomonas composti]
MRWQGARRRATTTAAVVTVPALVAVLAVMSQGFPLARVDLNDGAVWLTATSLHKLGRYNVQIDELNAGIVTDSTDYFDVLQDEGDVLLVESGQVSVVDPRTVSVTTQVAAPDTVTSMAAGTVAMVDGEGELYVRTLAGLDGLRVGDDDADVELGEGGLAVVTHDGVALGVAADGTVTRAEPTAGAARTESAGQLEGAAGSPPEQLTAVGDEPVALRGSTLLTTHGTVELPGDDLVLQRPGPASSRVLVASRTALLEVPIDGGDVVEHATQGSGAPAAPVQVDSCAHGAWASAVGSYLELCEGKAQKLVALKEMSAQDKLVFRVNRSMVVLNDTERGRLWLPQEDAELHVPNWEDISRQEEPQESEEESDSPDTTQELVTECSSQSSPPVAADDEFGVRPGRTTILPVMGNDSSSDCGILVVREFEQLDESFGRVEAVAGGRALQVDVAAGARGTAHFSYTIDDGRGVNPPSTATVTLVARDVDANSPPRSLHDGSMDVELGGSSTYQALADFEDPDGDDMLLVGAIADPAAGSVRFRQDGTVTFRADGGRLGRTAVTLQVSDGSDAEPTEGTLWVDVRPSGSVPPRIDPVHAVTYVDQAVTLDVLAAVRTTGDQPARLVSVDDVAGATVDADLQAGTFTFSTPRAGPYYVPFLVVAGAQQATGLARIDVQPWPDEVQPPVAVRDRAFLPAGGEVTIDPLANDSDPAGAVLVLQSVDSSDAPGLSVAVLDHHLVQITSDQTLERAVALSYTVSNGARSAVGQIVVQPVPPATSTQPPIVENVEATVRTGGVVTVPVLDHAYDPDGDALSLVRELAESPGPGEGLMFVSGDVLRYQAPATPMTVRATFVVQDATGNQTAATVTVRVHDSDPETKSPPRPQDLVGRVFAGEQVRITVPLVGIDDDGDGVTLLGVASAPSKGYVAEIGPDWIEYVALPGETGTDEFTYAVEDWVGQRAVATVRVGISPRPQGVASVVARDDEVTIRPGERIEVRVLANDTDSSGDELSLDPTLEMPAGTQAQAKDRRIEVTAPDEETTLQIVYTATNARGGRDTAVLTVHVTQQAPVLPPLARDVVVPATETFGLTEVVVKVLDVAQNPSGPASDLQVELPASVPATVARVDEQGRVVVTLADQTQTLPYLLRNVRDPEHAFSYAFITVPARDAFPPTRRPGAPALRVGSDEKLEISLSEQVKVAQGRSPSVADPLAVSATKGSAKVKNGDASTIVFQPAEGYAGPASVTVPVTDARDASDTTARTSYITFPIEVFAVEDHPPTFAPSRIDVAPGEDPVHVDLRVFTTGPEGTTPTDDRYDYQISSAVPDGFTVTIDDGVLDVSADATTAKGTDGTLGVRIGYGRAGSLDATVQLHVTASTRQTARVLDRQIDDAQEGTERTVDVLDDAFNPFPDSPLRVVGATVETPGAGTTRFTSSQVMVRPADDFIGSMVVRFRVRDVTDDPARETEGRIRLTVRGVPAAPGVPRVVDETDKAVQLEWDAPDNRGAQIDRYRVTAQPGGATKECASTVCTIDGLTNGTAYQFTVEAHNAVGWSPASPASRKATPDAVPDAVASITLASFGDGTLRWSWPEATSSGTPVDSYTVTITPRPERGEQTVTRSVPNVQFANLVNGNRYRITVVAHNRAEGGSPSTSSGDAVPAREPDAPASVSARREETPIGGRITVDWTAPAFDGGHEVRGYRVVAHGGDGHEVERSFGPSERTWSFEGARNGVEYTFSVRASSDAGESTATTATALTYGLPGTPVLDDPVAPAWTGTVALTWRAVDDNGAAVTYDIEMDGVVARTGLSATNASFADLAGGSQHTFRVIARNAAGNGGWSAPRSVVATTPPGTPTVTRVEGIEPTDFDRPTKLAIAWDPVASGGGTDLRYEYVVTFEGRSRTVSATDVRATSAVIDLSPTDISPGRDGTVVTVTVHAIATLGASSRAGADGSGRARVTWGAAPSPVQSLTLTPDDLAAPTTLTAAWSAPASDGGSSVRYRYCWYVDGAEVRCQNTSDLTVTRSLADLGISRDTDHTVKITVWATNNSADSDPVSAELPIPKTEPEPPEGG